MKTNIYLIILTILLGLNSFAASPCDSTFANFNYTTNGLTVNLDGVPSGPYTQSSWSIYDANDNLIWASVVAEDTSYTFANVGTYYVIFQLEYTYDTLNGWACYDTLGQFVTVDVSTSICDSLLANFDYTVNGLTVNLDGLPSHSHSESSWYIYDANDDLIWTNVVAEDTSYTFSNAGTYYVIYKLNYIFDTVNGGACNDTLGKYITVGSTTSICDSISNSSFYTTVNGNQVTVYGSTANQSSSTSYDMGGSGNFINGNHNTLIATYEYDNPGTYTIEWSVYYYDTTLPGNYCGDTSYQTVTIGQSLCDSIDSSYFTVSVNGNTVTLNGYAPAGTEYMRWSSFSSLEGTLIDGDYDSTYIVWEYNTPGTKTINWVVGIWDTIGNSLVWVCGDTITQTITIGDSSLSLMEVKQNIAVKAFPNPFDNDINIYVDFNTSINARLEIVNGLGQTVYEETIQQMNLLSKNIALNHLESGMYLFVLKEVNTNEILKTHRLIKK